MFLYIIYLVFLLSVIAFSPTRYFSFSLIALVSAIPGILYCLYKQPSKIQTCLLLLFLVGLCSGWNNDFQLEDFGRRLPNSEILSSTSIWLLSFIVMKLILFNDELRKVKFLPIYFLVFFILGVLVMAEEILVGGNAMDEGSNSVYYVLPVLPCVMFYYPKYRYHALILVSLLIVLSIKRSAFLIIAFSVLWLLFCSYRGVIKINKNIFKVLIVLIIALLLVFTLGSNYVDAIISRFSGISEDGGSGRDLIFAAAYDLFLDLDFKQQFLGNGPRYFWYSVSTISAAHNDFLEIMISCGIVGVILFVCLHIQFIKLLIYFSKRKSEMAIPLGISYFTFLIWNLIACQFAYQSTTVCTFMFWALAEYYMRNEKKNLIRCN